MRGIRAATSAAGRRRHPPWPKAGRRRGGGARAGRGTDVDLLALDEALTSLARIDPRGARIIELRFFSGLTLEETAEVMGISAGTVKRDWNAARAWLYREMRQAL